MVVGKLMAASLSAILALSLIACGSETAQEDDEKNTGSAPRETGQSEDGRLTRVGRPASPMFGSSCVSPLTEVFGDVFSGRRTS